jgi:hypothetical protein
MAHVRQFGRQFGALLGLLTLAGACSATKEKTEFVDGDGGAASSTSGAGGAGGQGGDGGSILPGTGGAGGNNSTSNTGCAKDTTEAQQVPLDMYIMLDQSGSMDGGSWTSVTSALGKFVQQPGTDGISVGLQYFPLQPGGGPVCPDTCNTDADCGACGPCQALMPGFPIMMCKGSTAGDSCVAADYANPEVEIEPLPGVAPKVVDSMSKHKPSGGTPTSAALQGAVDHAKAWAAAHPNHTVIVVFASDGEPQGCDTNLSNINAIAAAAFNSTPSIPTFVIGVGSKISALNGIAAAGGTGTAVFAEGSNVDQQFLDAMNKIRGTALSCSYLIPMPEKGTPDYGAVNVQYTPGGGQGDYIKKVIDQAACGTGEGWYYDNDAAPTTIIMCPSTCDKFKQDSEGKVDIVTGCKSIVQ